jgi:hypothetical protein
VIEIEEENGDPGPGFARICYGGIEALVKKGAVGKAGEAVIKGEEMDLFLGSGADCYDAAGNQKCQKNQGQSRRPLHCTEANGEKVHPVVEMYSEIAFQVGEREIGVQNFLLEPQSIGSISRFLKVAGNRDKAENECKR